jgi:hypothetical protein
MGGYREGIGPVAGGTAVSTPVEQPFPLRIECWSDGHWKNGDKQRISARWVASRLLELLSARKSEACHHISSAGGRSEAWRATGHDSESESRSGEHYGLNCSLNGDFPGNWGCAAEFSVRPSFS